MKANKETKYKSTGKEITQKIRDGKMKHTNERCQTICGAGECFNENQARCIQNMLIGKICEMQGAMDEDGPVKLRRTIIKTNLYDLYKWAVCLGEACDYEKASL